MMNFAKQKKKKEEKSLSTELMHAKYFLKEDQNYLKTDQTSIKNAKNLLQQMFNQKEI